MMSDSNSEEFDEIKDEKGATSRRNKKTYKHVPDELRKMIVNSIENGSCSRKEASETFNVPYGSVVAIYKRFLDTGKTCKKKGGTESSKKLTEEHKEFLQKLLRDNCKYTMKELKGFLRDEFEIDLSVTTISRSIPTFLFTIERIDKPLTGPISPEQVLERKVYCEHFMCVNNSERMVIYFGEADFLITMRQLAHREAPGVGPQVINPTIKLRKKTVMATMTKHELLLLRVVKGPANNGSLAEYFVGFFALLEKRKIHGAVIVIDDSIFTRFQEVKELIEQAGHLLLILTENCPFLNPVENVIGEWCRHVRAKTVRSETEMDVAVASFRKLVNGDQCAKFCQTVVDNARDCVAGTSG